MIDPDELARAIERRRGVGRVVCRVRPRRPVQLQPLVHERDDFAELLRAELHAPIHRSIDDPFEHALLGLEDVVQLGGRVHPWHELPSSGARGQLIGLVRHEPLFDDEDQPVMSQGEAAELVDHFWGRFGAPARAFWRDHAHPLSRALLERGLAVLDEQHVGLLWLLDEPRRTR